jgi:hypothetical protein
VTSCRAQQSGEPCPEAQRARLRNSLGGMLCFRTHSIDGLLVLSLHALILFLRQCQAGNSLITLFLQLSHLLLMLTPQLLYTSAVLRLESCFDLSMLLSQLRQLSRSLLLRELQGIVVRFHKLLGREVVHASCPRLDRSVKRSATSTSSLLLNALRHRLYHGKAESTVHMSCFSCSVLLVCKLPSAMQAHRASQHHMPWSRLAHVRLACKCPLKRRIWPEAKVPVDTSSNAAARAPDGDKHGQALHGSATVLQPLQISANVMCQLEQLLTAREQQHN